MSRTARGDRGSRRDAVKAIVGALGAMAVALVVRGLIREIAAFRSPRDNPRAFLRNTRPRATRTLVVCAGDSITHGVMSADYLATLRARLGRDGYEFVNAGINGNLAWNVLQRLDDVVACRPDAVTLLVGTNDVLATLGPAWEPMYRRQQHIPVTPTLAWYVENLRDDHRPPADRDRRPPGAPGPAAAGRGPRQRDQRADPRLQHGPAGGRVDVRRRRPSAPRPPRRAPPGRPHAPALRGPPQPDGLGAGTSPGAAPVVGPGLGRARPGAPDRPRPPQRSRRRRCSRT